MKKNELLHITTNHSGKMRGMQSLSTSCATNENCKRNAQIEGSICAKCYAQQMMAYYSKMSACFERNAEVLTSRVLTKEELPLINACYFRFESFGDLNNTTQLINYFNICKKNPDVHFALWTKNPQIVAEVVKENSKPKNLVIIASSLMINREINIDDMPYIDKAFTVYTKEYIKDNEVQINCGARNCLQCHRCYKKTGDRYIREILK